jgi:ketosteroid isomerase-like protein
MNDQPKRGKYSGVRDQEIRAALDQHWAASDANDFETEHRIYHEDAVLEYPQSGERTRGRRNIQDQRASQPSKKRFAVRRIKAAVIFGLPNSSSHMTASRPTP